MIRPASPRPGWFVLVAGWPAAGKSTLARALAAELGLPLLAKDEIKEALMDGLGYPPTVAESHRLGRAAVLAMLRVAQRCPGAVLDSTWFEYADPLVRQLPGRCVEVICTVPVQVARARYQARAGQRHAGHLDGDRTGAELWGSPPRSPRAGPVLAVDTSGPVDISELAATLTRLFSTNAGT
ncbi:MAG TPA: AAA family ATPase [Streptosporangiaceae bacterium]